jgi:hypothetical protein
MSNQELVERYLASEKRLDDANFEIKQIEAELDAVKDRLAKAKSYAMKALNDHITNGGEGSVKGGIALASFEKPDFMKEYWASMKARELSDE